MEQHSININIFGRRFPMKVTNEEAIEVQQAAKTINDQISEFREVYANQDDLNIAIMCCLKFATENIKNGKSSGNASHEALDALSALEKKLDKALEDS